ncbi:hypothetical protein GCM10010174_16600 [Kutzneria viridogrisea]
MPFGSFTVAKGTFLAPPRRAAKGPFAASNAVKATFAAVVAGAQRRQRHLRDVGGAGLAHQRTGLTHRWTGLAHPRTRLAHQWAGLAGTSDGRAPHTVREAPTRGARSADTRGTERRHAGDGAPTRGVGQEQS